MTLWGLPSRRLALSLLLICAWLLQCTKATSVCGDAHREAGEQCDDGNLIPGDGCDENCDIETNYNCYDPGGSGNPSICSSTCASAANGVIRWSPPDWRYSGSVLDSFTSYYIDEKEECAAMCLSRDDCAAFEWKNGTKLCAMTDQIMGSDAEVDSFSGRKICTDDCTAIGLQESDCFRFPCHIGWEWRTVDDFTSFEQHDMDCGGSALLGHRLLETGDQGAWFYWCCPHPPRTETSLVTIWHDDNALGQKVFVQIYDSSSPLACPGNAVFTRMWLKHHPAQDWFRWEYRCTDLSAFSTAQKNSIACQSFHIPAKPGGHGISFSEDSWRQLKLFPIFCEAYEGLNSINMTVHYESDTVGNSFDVSFDYRCCETNICGDGYKGGNEQCDDGNNVDGDGCSSTCIDETAVCGNGSIDVGESCDDNNEIDDDGCSAGCSIESGWSCPMPGSPCNSVCGDGQLKGSEQCDDGNTDTGDGCSSLCILQGGWTCPVPGSPCLPEVTESPTTTASTSPPSSIIDDITDDVDKLKDVNETQLVDAIDQLLTEEQTDGPTPPPVDSIDAFGERLLRAIKVAAALKNTDRDAALPNVTEGDTKAQKRVIMRALLKDLSKVATERSINLSGVSSSPAEVLLSAVTLATTIEAADEAESDDIADTSTAVSTFSSLVNVSRNGIEETDNVTPEGTAKALNGIGHFLDTAAGLYRQLNRTAKSLRASNRRLADDAPAYHDLASDIHSATRQLGDSLVPRVALQQGGSFELSSAAERTHLRVATRDQAQQEAMLSMVTAQQSVGVQIPSAVDSSITNCNGGQTNTAESVQLIWWSEDPYAYASSDEQQDATNVTSNNTLTRGASQGAFTVSGRQCGSDMELRASSGGEPFRIYLPRPPSQQLRRSLRQTAQGNMTVIVNEACAFWNNTIKQWDTQGCKVNQVLSNSTTLCCECDHLTDFGSVFRSVIVDSSLADVLSGADGSLKKMADITAWVQNVAGMFIFIMILIHLTCLALAIYFDCKHPITDEILLDIWMTDPLLDARHKARSRLQKGIHQCTGRAYHPFWCDFLLCRCFGGCWMHLRRREPTVHLQELRTLRSVRYELWDSFTTPFTPIEAATPPMVSNVPQTAADKKTWSSRGISMSTLWTADMESAKGLRSRVQAPVPSLSDFIKHTFTKKQEKEDPSACFEVKKTLKDLSDATGPPRNWSVVSGTSLSIGEEEKAVSGGSSPARRRASRRLDSQLREEGRSDEEERTPPQRQVREVSFTPSIEGRMDAKGMQIFQQVLQDEKKKYKRIDLIKSGVLKEALRSRLLLDLQRQQAAAVLIQLHWRAILERKAQKVSPQVHQKEEDRVPAIEEIPTAMVIGRPQETEDPQEPEAQEAPQDDPRNGRKLIGFESAVVQPGDSSDSPKSLEALATMVDPEGSPTNADARDDDEDSEFSPKLHKGQTIPIADLPSQQQQRQQQKEVKITVDEAEKPTHKVQGKTPTAASRRKSVTDLWVDLNSEVDLMVTRTLRRVEYVEWGPARLFREVVRRDHPLLKLFILNPTYTAVQRTLFFGSISLGILTMCAVFFDRTKVTGEGAETVLLSFQTQDVAWQLTLRQIAVLIWSVILSKPVPLLLIFLFRKLVPHIKPSPTRSAMYAGFKGGGGHRIAEITGRHSGHFPMKMKQAVLARWRKRERIGIAIALIYWFACDAFLLLFAFSERLAEYDARPPHVVYQDFVMACSVEFLNTFILQPLLMFMLLSLLLTAILRIGFCDWIVWMMPHWFDFTHVHALSLHELTIQLQAITDTQELTRGILGFAGLNIDSIGMAADVFSF